MKNTEKRIEEIRKALTYIENLKNPDWEAKTEEYYLRKELEELENGQINCQKGAKEKGYPFFFLLYNC